MSCLKYIIIVFIGLCCLALASCRSIRGYNSKPAKNSVFDGKDQVEINVIAYHENDSVTRVFYRIATDHLMFKKKDTTSLFYSNVFIGCKLLPDINSRTIIDSTSIAVVTKFPEVNESNYVEGSFSLKLKRTSFAYLDLWVIDRNKNIEYTCPITIDKYNDLVEQNFLVYSNNKLAYKNTFYAGEEVVIASSLNKQKTIYVDCFHKDFSLALPPFSTQKPDEFKYKPDSTFNLTLDQNIHMTMPSHGFYHIKADASGDDGISLFTFERSYPGVNNIDEMINCTRYIMRSEEFESCKNASDQKACIDNFWLSIAGSNERARELLKKYYGRVKEANKKYTSYTQGWKTDRGMISIIFGEPINTYRSKSEEIWVYGPESDVNSLRFIFKKTENPFSNNDFILIRSYVYKEPWYTAVDFWRQGRLSIEK